MKKYFSNFDEYQAQQQSSVNNNPATPTFDEKRKVKSTLLQFTPEKPISPKNNSTRWTPSLDAVSSKSIDELLKQTIKPTARLKLYEKQQAEQEYVEHVVLPQAKIINATATTISSTKQERHVEPANTTIQLPSTKNNTRQHPVSTTSDMILQLRTERMQIMFAQSFQ